MCGICGVVVPDTANRRVTADLIERMRDTLVHRGPDDSGLYVAPGVGLGHRRLSIIDLAAGHQPMASDDESLHVVYNGEVFNHAAIRADLEVRGRQYRTRCDTEALLHLYAVEGARGVTRLRGMFAFAIWDARRRELLLARDRFGVKPLYYVLTADGSLFFASEIKALLAAGAIRPELNVDALPDYLANHAPSGEETLFVGVRRLPPGHTLRWKDGRIEIERYWDLSFAPRDSDSPSDKQIVTEYRDRLREAVRLRLMSDVPLGVFLSGGLDSAAITGLMTELLDEPVKTFSVGFAEREANELAYARIVAKRFRTDHHEVVVRPEEFFGALPSLVWHEDEPIAHSSSVPLHFVAQLASQHVKVVLTGEGSDETLAGYNRYRAALLNLQAGRRYETLVPGMVRGAVRRSIESLAAEGRFARRLSRTFLAMPADLDALYFDNFAVFSRARQEQLLTASLRDRVLDVDPYAAAHRAIAECDAPSELGRLLYADIATYLRELLMKQDQMSMAASVESRVPFLDHPLVEFTARLPDRWKLSGLTTKRILRKAMADLLPQEILARPKMGFPVPIDTWVRGPFRHLLDEYVLGPRALARGLFNEDYLRGLVRRHVGGENHGQRLWSLMNLEVWHRVFLEDETPARLVPAAREMPRAA